MTPEEIRKMLENAGITGDAQRLFTTTKENIPGLFNFTDSQSEMFRNLSITLPEFNPTLIKEGLDEVASYGKEQAGFIGGKLTTGMRDVTSGLGSGLLNITQKVGRGFDVFGARKKLFGEQRELASEAADDLRTKFDTSMSLLDEKLGARRATVRKGITDYRQNIQNLVQSIYAMDPGSGGGDNNNQEGFAQTYVDDWNFEMPDGAEKRYADTMARNWYSENQLPLPSGYEYERMLSDFTEAYQNSSSALSFAEWMESQNPEDEDEYTNTGRRVIRR